MANGMALCWVPLYVLSQCTPNSEGIGSIQFIARRQDLVWGSGLLISDQYKDMYREVLKQVALEQALSTCQTSQFPGLAACCPIFSCINFPLSLHPSSFHFHGRWLVPFASVALSANLLELEKSYEVSRSSIFSWKTQGSRQPLSQRLLNYVWHYSRMQWKLHSRRANSLYSWLLCLCIWSFS